MQKRFYNWKDDDYTLDMNHRDFIIRPHGRYAGFLLESINTSFNAVVLGHEVSNVRERVEIGESTSVGCWVTRQGVVIHESESITLPVNTNSIALPRIDIVIGSHEYKELTGGEVALYSVVDGTPSSNPVAPVVPNEAKDVILGYILVPASDSTDDLIYTRANTPDFSQDTTVLHSDRDMDASGYIGFKSSYPSVGPLVMVDIDNKEIVLTTYTGEDNVERIYSHYLVSANSQEFVTIDSVVAENGVAIPEGFLVHLRTFSKLKYSDTLLQGDAIRSNGDTVCLQKKTEGVWYGDGSKSILDTNAVFDKMVVLNQGGTQVVNNVLMPTAEDGYLGNIWDVIGGAADAVTSGIAIQKEIQGLSTADWRNLGTDKTDHVGAVVILSFSDMSDDATIILRHDHTITDDGVKPLWFTSGRDVLITADSTMLCIETANYWKVVGLSTPTEVIETVADAFLNDPWIDLPVKVVNGFSIASGVTPAQYKISANKLCFRGVFSVDNATYPNSEKYSASLTDSLGLDYRPSSEIRKPIQLQIISPPNVDNTYDAVLIITTDGAIDIRLIGGAPTATFAYLDGLMFDLT